MLRGSPLLLGACGGLIGVLIACFLFFRHSPTNPYTPLTHQPPKELSTSATTSSPTTEPSVTTEPTERTATTTDLTTVTAATVSTHSTTTLATTNTQYVVLAFDGSRSLDMWKQTRAFAKEMATKGAPIHFTYFINTVYLLAAQHHLAYAPPGHPTGTSPIGFASSEQDVANRLEQMNAALDDGHELGCHLSGHFNGASWTKSQWNQEFQSFFDLIKNVATINHLEQEPEQRRTLKLPPEGMVGFRAPELGVNKDLWPVLKERHFQYDTSLTAKPGSQPTRLANGLWEFPLEKIPFAGSPTSSLLSMDYNFYFKQSQAKDVATKGTPLWDQYYNEVLTSYRDYFNKSYSGNHAPLFIGHHFSLWNDGVYWEAMKTFASEVCGLPNVKCVSYKEVMRAMN